MSSQPTRLVRSLTLLCVVVAAVVARLGPRDHLLQRQGLLIHDLDTLRRLARLDAIDAAAHYPVVEVRDGFPAGSTLHWTLPMDWVIRALDPLAGWMFPTERGYEAGAVVAGPVLAAAAVCVFVALVARLLGFWPALVAGLLYGLAYSCVNMSLLGNGDHQTLQMVALALAVPGVLLTLQAAIAGKSPARWAAAAGGALGFSVWVSTEMMLLFYVLAVAFAAAAVWPWKDDAHRVACRRVVLPWSLGVFALLCVGHVVEHRDHFAALHWDSVSWFQLWQAGVFAAFAGALWCVARRGVPAVGAAAAGALVLGLVPLSVSAVRIALGAQIAGAGDVTVWLHSEVSEFRSLFGAGFIEGIETWIGRDSWLVLLLPVALFALRWSPLGGPARLVAIASAAGTLGLYVWEVKLGHLFGLLFPLVAVAGWQGASARLRLGRWPWLGPAAALAAVCTVWRYLPPPRAPLLRTNDEIVREICARVAPLAANARDASVLAPWDMGASLMYFGGAGVVASGYHRNFEGIRDGFRFWLTDVAEQAAALEILRRRRVRWVVAWHDRGFLLGGALTIGKAPLRTEQEILPAAKRTMFWRLRYESPPGFRLVAEGPQIRRHRSDPPEPIYRLWEVVP